MTAGSPARSSARRSASAAATRRASSFVSSRAFVTSGVSAPGILDRASNAAFETGASSRQTSVFSVGTAFGYTNWPRRSITYGR